MQPVQRLPHAVLDIPSRYRKGLKIERLLKLHLYKQSFSLLEIGTGSGGIAHYFANHQILKCNVTAVDVLDSRQISDGYQFVLVKDTTLPFENACFDIVLSNHVMEHVGDEEAQKHHISEIKRVLKPSGTCYLAVPNRWMLVEPHYKLVFLSWLPAGLRNPYLRLMRRGSNYDCNPLSQATLERLLNEQGLLFRNIGTLALHEFLTIEATDNLVYKVVSSLPDALIDSLAFIMPTHIYIIKKYLSNYFP